MHPSFSEARDETTRNVSQAAEGLDRDAGVLAGGLAADMAAREPRPGWVLLKGFSAISDALPPQAYASLGFADGYNKAVRKFRRRMSFSAFMTRVSRSEIEAQLKYNTQLIAELQGQQLDKIRHLQTYFYHNLYNCRFL